MPHLLFPSLFHCLSLLPPLSHPSLPFSSLPPFSFLSLSPPLPPILIPPSLPPSFFPSSRSLPSRYSFLVPSSISLPILLLSFLPHPHVSLPPPLSLSMPLPLISRHIWSLSVLNTKTQRTASKQRLKRSQAEERQFLNPAQQAVLATLLCWASEQVLGVTRARSRICSLAPGPKPTCTSEINYTKVHA